MKIPGRNIKYQKIKQRTDNCHRSRPVRLDQAEYDQPPIYDGEPFHLHRYDKIQVHLHVWIAHGKRKENRHIDIIGCKESSHPRNRNAV